MARDILNSDVPMPMPDTTSTVDVKMRLPIKLPQILRRK